MKNKIHIWARLIATFIDLSAIYCVALLFQILIYQFSFIPFGLIFITVLIFYYTLSYYYTNGFTPSKYLAGIRIVPRDSEKLQLSTILLREIVYKGITVTILLNYYAKSILPDADSSIALLFLGVTLIILLLLLVFYRQNWWEYFSKTKTVKIDNREKKWFLKSILFILILFAITIISVLFPFIAGNKNINEDFLVSYPRTKEVRQYANYIKVNSHKPVDYIFELFKKNDIVVLSERLHPEYTQYELIFDIINDKRFVTEVGNIFTECGSVSYQDSLDKYLLTNFESEEMLNKATAHLQRNSNSTWPLWSNTNLFDLFKNVNKLNCSTPDSSKIKWYFTNLPVNWETATHQTFIKNYTNPKSDSLMADKVIDVVKNVFPAQKRRKALVIMNTYHGYGTVNNGQNCFGSTAGYLMASLPGKVANVMLNTVMIKSGIIVDLVCKGKWDKAFSILNYPDAGFDFAGSPFGEDKFALRSTAIKNLKYKDVFTGYIFYKPISKQFKSVYFPYMFENFEETILKRAACVDQNYVEIIKSNIDFYKRHKDNPTFKEPLKYILVANYVKIVALSIMLIINFILISLLYFRNRKKL